MVNKIDKVLPKEVNKEIIRILKATQGWYFGYDEDKNDNLFNYDQGLAIQTFNEKPIDNVNYQSLNMFAFIILHKINDELNLKLSKLHRVNYNFYHPFSKGKLHIDYTNNNFYTILYNLNTNDGYTEIENIKYYSNESEALFFKSNIKHFGCGPTKNLRYNLNIVCS
jgi:hypothetical protein